MAKVLGVRVDDTRGHGTCLVATREFAPGEIVLVEKPKFVLNSQSPSPPKGLLDAVAEVTKNATSNLTRQLSNILALWSSCDVSQQTEMADGFFSTPDQAEMTTFLEGLIREVQARWAPLQKFEASSLTRALQAWLLSAHETDDDGSGLYHLGCRANSCCAPNVAFHSEPGTNRLTYRAIKPIARDEQICFSYLIATDLTMPTYLRQKRLQAAKYFTCGCERCACDSDPERSLPCARPGCAGLTTPCQLCASPKPDEAAAADEAASSPTWRCGRCANTDTPSETTLAREEALTRAAMLGAPTSDDTLASLEADALWHRHWVWGESLWVNGIAKLRGGVERGNDDSVWTGMALCKRHLAVIRLRGHPPHYVSARAAEAFACLEALSLVASQGGHVEKARAAAAAAVQVAASYIQALEAEYGCDDEHNVRMRAFCRDHCGQCGGTATSRCSRCKMVGYCSVACQKAAWKEHKEGCVKC